MKLLGQLLLCISFINAIIIKVVKLEEDESPFNACCRLKYYGVVVSAENKPYLVEILKKEDVPSAYVFGEDEKYMLMILYASEDLKECTSEIEDLPEHVLCGDPNDSVDEEEEKDDPSDSGIEDSDPVNEEEEKDNPIDSGTEGPNPIDEKEEKDNPADSGAEDPDSVDKEEEKDNPTDSVTEDPNESDLANKEKEKDSPADSSTNHGSPPQNLA